MKIKYFQDTDTLYLVLNDNLVTDTEDLDDNTLVDLDADGHVVSITFEHASDRTDIASFTFQQIAAPVPA